MGYLISVSYLPSLLLSRSHKFQKMDQVKRIRLSLDEDASSLSDLKQAITFLETLQNTVESTTSNEASTPVNPDILLDNTAIQTYHQVKHALDGSKRLVESIKVSIENHPGLGLRGHWKAYLNRITNNKLPERVDWVIQGMEHFPYFESEEWDEDYYSLHSGGHLKRELLWFTIAGTNYCLTGENANKQGWEYKLEPPGLGLGFLLFNILSSSGELDRAFDERRFNIV